MEHSTSPRRHWSPRGLVVRLLVALLVVGGASLVVTGQSAALSTVTMRVIIEEIVQEGCTDSTDGSDFYAFLTVAGETVRFPRIDDRDTIRPTDWSVERLLDVSTSPVPVRIDLWEFDNFGNFEDDHCDIAPHDGEELDLSVALVPCAVSGDLTGACSTALTSTGNGGGDGNARITFRIEVDEPPAADGLTVRCTHSPLWPQPGDDVTITAQSLDGSVEVDDGVDHTEIADEIEIWVGDRTGPDKTDPGKTTTSFLVPAVPAGDLVYGCRVRDGGASVFTGWRRTRVGPPAEEAAVPVVYTGERKDRVDIVFIADVDSYDEGATDPDFLGDVAAVLSGAYYGQSYFLANQDKFNFWLADRTGDADSVPDPDAPDDVSKNSCVHSRPDNWATDYTWADSGAILHTDVFRDCAGSRVFSVEPASLDVVLHETGHAPFGLADEYGGPNFGGYFESDATPNLRDTKVECEADAVALGRVADDCRSFTDTRPDTDETWWLSDPVPAAPPEDLMDANGPPRAADVLRMDWFFGNCLAGQC